MQQPPLVVLAEDTARSRAAASIGQPLRCSARAIGRDDRPALVEAMLEEGSEVAGLIGRSTAKPNDARGAAVAGHDHGTPPMTERSLAPASCDGKVTVEPDAFREALGAVCTPLAIVTSQFAARPHGTTVSAFCSLSLAPPLVLVSLDRTSRLLAMIRTTGRFGINVLEHGQEALATRFATKLDDRFAGIAWSTDHGLPRIHGGGSWIACQLEKLLEGGDHEIVVGLVEHAEQRARSPLLYQHRTFRRLWCIPLADKGPSSPARARPRRPLGVASREDSDGRLAEHSAGASCRGGR